MRIFGKWLSVVRLEGGKIELVRLSSVSVFSVSFIFVLYYLKNKFN